MKGVAMKQSLLIIGIFCLIQFFLPQNAVSAQARIVQTVYVGSWSCSFYNCINPAIANRWWIPIRIETFARRIRPFCLRDCVYYVLVGVVNTDEVGGCCGKTLHAFESNGKQITITKAGLCDSLGETL